MPEYSTFPFDMDPEILPEGNPVPVNALQVSLTVNYDFSPDKIR